MQQFIQQGFVRNLALSAEPDPDQPILDATVECLAQLGPRRMSMADIARRAGITRTTLYRKYDDRQDLIATAIAHESQRQLQYVARQIAAMDAADRRLIDGFVWLVEHARAHPIVISMSDPLTRADWHEYLDESLSQVLEHGISIVARWLPVLWPLDQYQYEPQSVAQIYVRCWQSLVMVPVFEQSQTRTLESIAASLVQLIQPHG